MKVCRKKNVARLMYVSLVGTKHTYLNEPIVYLVLLK